MARVFDTSSLMSLCLDDDAPELSIVFDEHVLDLAFYEAGNVLWKAQTLQDRLTAEEQSQLISIVSDLREEVVVQTLDDIGFEAVMDIASETELTFYDAAHLTCAIEVDGALITEDESLRAVADDRITASSVTSFD